MMGTHGYLTEVLVPVDTVLLYSSIICVNLCVLSGGASLRQFY